MLLQCMYVRNTKPRSYRELSHIFSSQVGTENKAGDCLHPVLHSQDQARLSAIVIRIVTGLLETTGVPRLRVFMLPPLFTTCLAGLAVGRGRRKWSETNIEPSVRLTLFDLCATTAVAPYGLLKSDARRMQLLRVETCLHAWTLLSWSCPAVALAGGMILLHACVTCSSPSRYLHLRVFKSLTLPETVRMEHLQAVKLCCNICVTQPGRADLPCLGAPGARMLYSRSLNSFTHEPPVLPRLKATPMLPGSSSAQGSHMCRVVSVHLLALHTPSHKYIFA